MGTNSNNIAGAVIEAAGGLLWQETPNGYKLAVVHRPGYDDWSLPKGKRETDESWQETALREIKEETGCKTKLTGFAGSTAYTVNGVAKVVLFWHMALAKDNTFEPNNEVDQLVWLTTEEAVDKLSYENEKILLRNQMVE